MYQQHRKPSLDSSPTRNNAIDSRLFPSSPSAKTPTHASSGRFSENFTIGTPRDSPFSAATPSRSLFPSSATPRHADPFSVAPHDESVAMITSPTYLRQSSTRTPSSPQSGFGMHSGSPRTGFGSPSHSGPAVATPNFGGNAPPRQSLRETLLAGTPRTASGANGTSMFGTPNSARARRNMDQSFTTPMRDDNSNYMGERPSSTMRNFSSSNAMRDDLSTPHLASKRTHQAEHPTSCWVTIFGFRSEQLVEVVHHFSNCGEIVRYEQGGSNWVHVRFVDTLAAAAALAKNGRVVGDAMFGVVPCQDENVMLRLEDESLTRTPRRDGLSNNAGMMESKIRTPASNVRVRSALGSSISPYRPQSQDYAVDRSMMEPEPAPQGTVYSKFVEFVLGV